jgi:hypothetical protein
LRVSSPDDGRPSFGGRIRAPNPAFHLATAAIHVSVAVVDVSDALLHFAEPNPRFAPGFPGFRSKNEIESRSAWAGLIENEIARPPLQSCLKRSISRAIHDKPDRRSHAFHPLFISPSHALHAPPAA